MVVGRSRVLGLERAFAPGAIACLVLGAGACSGPGPSQSGPNTTLPGGVGGVGGAFSVVPSAGRPTIDPIQIEPIVEPVSNPPCSVPFVTEPVFAQQVFDRTLLARREFFSWTTDEQAAELRRDQILFTRSERPGMGPGYAFEFLEQFARDSSQPERAMLASLIGGQLFAKARFAWTEPWATRMGWPGEVYGGKLLRIVLKPQAWLVIVRGAELLVFDQQNESVSLAEALADPTRLGAIYYEKDAAAGGPRCGGSFVSGGNGYREFILGNLAMVEEWSLGTQQIRDRLSANIQQLSTFLQRFRGCPVTSSALQWNLDVVCAWSRSGAARTELEAYERSLAIPSDNYLAVPERIATMIETLQGDLFEPDPLLITPGNP
jgi:hypothetical protein